MSKKKFIAYYRVSTGRQEASGLGLAAQENAVLDYIDNEGGELLESYTEVKSGMKGKRPKLEAALRSCRKEKATLIIAKLDRLARNVHFISGLLESKIDFVVVDNPHATKFMIHLLAAFAEYERDMISRRTKEGLAVAKARGKEIGRYGKEVLSKQNKEKADEFALEMTETINGLRSKGFKTVRALRDALNDRKIPTCRGGRWHIPTIHRLIKRIEKVALS